MGIILYLSSVLLINQLIRKIGLLLLKLIFEKYEFTKTTLKTFYFISHFLISKNIY